MIYASWRYLFLDIASKGTCKKLSAEQQFFLCRYSADWIELSKKEPITAVQICVLSALPVSSKGQKIFQLFSLHQNYLMQFSILHRLLLNNLLL